MKPFNPNSYKENDKLAKNQIIKLISILYPTWDHIMPDEEFFKKGDVIFEKPCGNHLVIEGEVRHGRSANRLFAFEFPTVHIPARKSPDKKAVGWDYYMVTNGNDHDYFIIMHRDVVDLKKEYLMANTDAGRIKDSFVNVSLSDSLFGKFTTDGDVEYINSSLEESQRKTIQ